MGARTLTAPKPPQAPPARRPSGPALRPAAANCSAIRLIHTSSGGVVSTKYEVLHADQLGSLRQITGETGAVVHRKAFETVRRDRL